jgi:hypothetical protein
MHFCYNNLGLRSMTGVCGLAAWGFLSCAEVVSTETERRRKQTRQAMGERARGEPEKRDPSSAPAPLPLQSAMDPSLYSGSHLSRIPPPSFFLCTFVRRIFFWAFFLARLCVRRCFRRFLPADRRVRRPIFDKIGIGLVLHAILLGGWGIWPGLVAI